MKDIELNVSKEKQSKSYNEQVINSTYSKSKNLSTLKSRLNYKNYPSRARTKPIIEFDPVENDYQKVYLENVKSPSRFVFRCKFCDKNNAVNNVN